MRRHTYPWGPQVYFGDLGGTYNGEKLCSLTSSDSYEATMDLLLDSLYEQMGVRYRVND